MHIPYKLTVQVVTSLGVVLGAVGGCAPKSPCSDDRVLLRCESEVSYQGKRVEGGVSVWKVDARAAYEERAIRRINDELAQYAMKAKHVCEQYNACLMEPQEYRAESGRLRATLDTLAEKAIALREATGDQARRHAISALYEEVIPERDRLEQVTFRMGLHAILPGQSGEQLVAPGEPLPTGARVRFTFEADKDAFVYVFQKDPKGKVAVLFPNPGISVSNPLRPGNPQQVPPGGQRFRLNAKDLGEERIFIVASRQPIGQLAESLEKISRGEVSVVSQDRVLASLSKMTTSEGAANDCAQTRALELEEPAQGCVRTRGLELEPAPQTGGAVTASVVLKTEAGDDTIAKVFPFLHVTAEQYPAAKATFDAQ